MEWHAASDIVREGFMVTFATTLLRKSLPILDAERLKLARKAFEYG